MNKQIRQPETKQDKPASEFSEKILSVDRVSRTVKGGRRIRFRVLVVVGNFNGKVGIGIAKAAEIPKAVAKASKIARKNFISVPIVNGTIPHQVNISYGGSTVFLKPAKEGSSIVAGGVIRTIVDLAGIKNISSKILGSNNKVNNAKTVIMALGALRAFKAEDKEKKEDQNEIKSAKKSKPAKEK